MLIEPVSVNGRLMVEPEARLGGEDLVPKPLRGFDKWSIGGQQKCVARSGESAGVGVVSGDEDRSGTHTLNTERVR